MICFDRNPESARLWRHFDAERSVLMLAPRRIGKTVLLNRLKGEAAKQGYNAVLLDVEGFRDERAFFRQLCAALQEELGFGQSLVSALTDRLRRTLGGTETFTDWRQILMNTEWKGFADHLMAQLEDDRSGLPWLLLVDEVPIFVGALLESSGPAAAHDFLYTLRNLRQKHPRVRWLFTGSIGLDAVARRHGLEGALADMEVFPLGPFDEATSLAFLDRLAARNRCKLEPAAAHTILRRLGWYSPYYLEKLIDLACDEVGAGGSVTPASADRAAEHMLALERRAYWATWREHLDRNFPEPERSDLFTVLDAIALAPDGLRIDALLPALNRGGRVVDRSALGRLLDTLVADGYLDVAADGTTARFRMTLLRDWWRRYVAPRPEPEAQDA